MYVFAGQGRFSPLLNLCILRLQLTQHVFSLALALTPADTLSLYQTLLRGVGCASPYTPTLTNNVNVC